MLAKIGFLAILCVGIALGLGYDRHPPMGWHTRVLVWSVGFDLPNSLATERDRAVAAGKAASAVVARCQGNVKALTAAQERANDQARRDGLETARRLKMLSEALQSARQADAHDQAEAAKLSAAQIMGVDACSRMDDVDQRVLEAYR